MKIRKGFVSNSSSSSFWIPIEVGEKHSNILEELGFSKTISIGARNVYFNTLVKIEDWKMLPQGYGISVSCNQDDILDELLAHNIQFEGYVHYGHYVYLYDGTSHYYIKIRNTGDDIAMYRGDDTFEQMAVSVINEPVIERVMIPAEIDKLREAIKNNLQKNE